VTFVDSTFDPCRFLHRKIRVNRDEAVEQRADPFDSREVKLHQFYGLYLESPDQSGKVEGRREGQLLI
jgi:hypothetical protein